MNLSNHTGKIRAVSVTIAAIFGLSAIFFEEKRIKRLEQESSTQARMLVAMKDCHTSVIEVMLGESTVSFANQEAHDMFGYDPGTLKGEPIINLVPSMFAEDHANAFIKAMKDSMDGELKQRVSAVKCMAKRKEGSEFPVVVRVYIGRTSIIALINRDHESNYIPTGTNYRPEADSKVKR